MDATPGRATPVRQVPVGTAEVVLDRRPDGATLVRSPEPLGDYPANLTERFAHWARTIPDAVFIAERDPNDAWRKVTYGPAYARLRAIAQALLDRGLTPERPVAILSDNDVEQALLALAAMHVGVPFAPVSSAYSLVSTDFEKLRYVFGLLTPGLVFAADAGRFGRAIAAVVPPGTEVVVARGEAAGRPRDAVDQTDVARDQRVRIVAAGAHRVAERLVAEHRLRDLVELDVAPAGGGERRELRDVDLDDVAEERLDVGVDGRIDAGIAARVVQIRRRRQRGLDRARRVPVRERDLVGDDRPGAPDPGDGERGRADLRRVARVVALDDDVADRVGAREPGHLRDEPEPPGLAPELAVGDRLEADRLLPADHPRDVPVLGLAQAIRVERRRGVAGVEQRPGAQQAADVLGAEGRHSPLRPR